ncbi:MAG TPA: glucose-1-phosphate adenylyltransferase, partial [Elusimicrobiota bacterium]|nr:glucose-1-phosphate adenylyltransferase [Elusimicrobiota bacterium]
MPESVEPSRTVVVLMAGGKGERLGPLTRDRAKPAVPFGGIYRIIDFALSNCLNSGLTRLLVLVQYKSRSLNQHVRDGWGPYFNSSRGEFVEPIPPQQRLGDQWYQGTADAVYQNLFAVREERPDAVLVLAGDHIYKMDYRRMLRHHAETGADMTVGAVEVPVKEASGFGVLEVDAANALTGFQEKSKTPKPIPDNPELCLASMGIYAFRPEALYELLEDDSRNPASAHDFGKDILPKLIGKGKAFAFRFVDENKKQSKYWRDVGTIDSYFSANMDLISVSPQLNLYDPSWPTYTARRTDPPPKFVFSQTEPGGRLGVALDSLVSPGCVVSGGKVLRSILSPCVRINSYSSVEDSILFENVNVGRRAKIRRAIVDKDVDIPEGMEIGYDLETDRKRFAVSEDGVVVISKRTS